MILHTQCRDTLSYASAKGLDLPDGQRGHIQGNIERVAGRCNAGRAAKMEGSGQLYLFETRKSGLLRTAGVVLRQDSKKICDLSREMADVCAKSALARTDAAARGKVAVMADHELRVLQVAGEGCLVGAFCGNATAAAILALKQPAGELQVEGPGAVRITAEFRCVGATVEQNWLIPGMTVSEFRWQGRYCARVTGLNSYWLVTGGLPVGFTAEMCRTAIASGHLNAKLAVLGHGSKRNNVAFYNASGLHGAAPMTGLASLAVAAHALPAFAAHLGKNHVTYQTVGGPEIYILPAITRAEYGHLRIALPDVEASLTPVSVGGTK
jgi:hypothetical protein